MGWYYEGTDKAFWHEGKIYLKEVHAQHFGDGSNLTNLPSTNPFDQDLNTTDSVTFSNLDIQYSLDLKNPASASYEQFVGSDGYGNFVLGTTGSGKDFDFIDQRIKTTNAILSNNFKLIDVSYNEYGLASLDFSFGTKYLMGDLSSTYPFDFQQSSITTESTGTFGEPVNTGTISIGGTHSTLTGYPVIKTTDSYGSDTVLFEGGGLLIVGSLGQQYPTITLLDYGLAIEADFILNGDGSATLRTFQGEMQITANSYGINFQDENFKTTGYGTIGGVRFLGHTSSSSAPSTTNLPNDKDMCIHKDTTSGALYLAFNDGGSTIKKTLLT